MAQIIKYQRNWSEMSCSPEHIIKDGEFEWHRIFPKSISSMYSLLSGPCGYSCGGPILKLREQCSLKLFMEKKFPDLFTVQKVMYEGIEHEFQPNVDKIIKLKIESGQFPDKEKYIKAAQDWINSVSLERDESKHIVRGMISGIPELQCSKDLPPSYLKKPYHEKTNDEKRKSYLYFPDYILYSYDYPSKEAMIGLSLMHPFKDIKMGCPARPHPHGN